MNRLIGIFVMILFFVFYVYGTEPIDLNSDWIPAKPEVLSYHSIGSNETSFYQVSVSQIDSICEVFINIVSPGFCKTVNGKFDKKMRPLESNSKIIIANQVSIETKCVYKNELLEIATTIYPFNQHSKKSIKFENQFIDFSQTPLLVRSLPLIKDKHYAFSMINPRNNTIMPVTLNVVGEERVQGIDCIMVELNDFEGKSIYWVTKTEDHTIIKIRQVESDRTLELIK